MSMGINIGNYRGKVKAALSNKITGLFSPKVACVKALCLSLA